MKDEWRRSEDVRSEDDVKCTQFTTWVWTQKKNAVIQKEDVEMSLPKSSANSGHGRSRICNGTGPQRLIEEYNEVWKWTSNVGGNP